MTQRGLAAVGRRSPRRCQGNGPGAERGRARLVLAGQYSQLAEPEAEDLPALRLTRRPRWGPTPGRAAAQSRRPSPELGSKALGGRPGAGAEPLGDLGRADLARPPPRAGEEPPPRFSPRSLAGASGSRLPPPGGILRSPRPGAPRPGFQGLGKARGFLLAFITVTDLHWALAVCRRGATVGTKHTLVSRILRVFRAVREQAPGTRLK